MGLLTGAMAAISIGSAAQQAGALNAQNEFSDAMSKINIRRAKAQEEDALDRGATQANKYRKSVNKLVGSQRVALAAQGIDISSGSANDFTTETEELGFADAQNIEANAFRESMGYGMQQTDYMANQIMNNAATRTRATSTLLGGVLGAGKYAAEAWGAPTPEKPTPPKPK